MGRLKGRGLAPRLAPVAGRLRPAVAGADDGRRSVDWLHTARWQRLRLKVLARDGYQCQQTGMMLTGKHPAPDSPVVDHMIPHRGDEALFWDEGNLQAVSKGWHDRQKQQMEKRGQI